MRFVARKWLRVKTAAPQLIVSEMNYLKLSLAHE